jgi:LysR family nitrogen assimilation transcriptional regulator
MVKPMDVRQLRYFAEVAANANFNRAAERLHVAQPALSRQIHKLQDELGVALFRRVGRGIALTRPGALLAEHANFILKQLERARDAVVAEATEPRGTAALGAPPSVGYSVFASIAERYAAKYPGVTLRLVEGMTHNLLQWLRTGQIDLAIITLPDANPASLDKDLALTRTIVEDLLVFGPPEIDRLPPLTSLKDLTQLPLILTSRPNMARLIMENAASRQNIHLDVRLEVESLHVMKDLVARGLGYGVVPRIGLYGETRPFRTSVIDKLKLVRAVTHRADRPPSIAVTELLALLHTTLDKLAAADAFEGPREFPLEKRHRQSRHATHGKTRPASPSKLPVRSRQRK